VDLSMFEVLILTLLAVLVAPMLAPALADLAARVRDLRYGARPLHGVARGGYQAVRESPGHRNFGIPRRADPPLPGRIVDVDGAADGLLAGMAYTPPSGPVARHILGDH
jgi:hypothetical protein